MEIAKQFGQTQLDDIKQDTEDIIASIRINPKHYSDAFISNPNGGPDIYIEGSRARNAAMEGDIVKVRLNHPSKWKLNLNVIANRWDDWSQSLLPIIDVIEKEARELDILAKQHDHLAAKLDNLSGSKPCNGENVLTRVKRNVSNGAQGSGSKKGSPTTSKLPSNLPPGISQLKVEHVINLPFSKQCLQKTGFVIDVVKRNHSGRAGGFLYPYSPQFALFSPTDSRVPRMLINISECPIDFVSQADRYKNILFVAQMSKWVGQSTFAEGNLVKIVGDSNQVQSRLEAMLLESQIDDTDFPPDVYAELEYLKNLPENWFSENSKGRRDLTNECVFTIDPKTARDLDDAVSIRQVAEQIYEVGVHIADVSHFVKEMTAVDYYARLRTTSVYLVDRVIPMLPRILCEQMCSLNPGEPKFTFSVIWKMDKYGHIIDQWFGRTIIKSCVKLAYEQAQDMIDNPNDVSWIQECINMPKLHAFDWSRISKSVVTLNKIAQNMRAKRFEGGALRIDQVKIKFELDPESGYPTGFTFEDRKAANCLIEEYMLLANMAVAKRIYQHSNEHAFLRRHPPSPAHHLQEVKEFCDAKGCPLDISSSGGLQKSLNAITDPTMLKVVSFLLLRGMKNAEYICVGSLTPDDDNMRHFALNVQFYTHFTSPIRRYPDIIVHRQLELALGSGNESHEDVSSLSLMADECTRRKISAKSISDTSQKLYFNLFVLKAGFCELLACVTRIYDQSFDVILVDYDRNGRVYLDKLKSHLIDYKFESFSGVKRLVLNWKPTQKMNDKKKKKSKRKEKDCHNHNNSRSNLESRKGFCDNNDFNINEAKDGRQVIEVFDVIRAIVTTDDKDITQLKIGLKVPN